MRNLRPTICLLALSCLLVSCTPYSKVQRMSDSSASVTAEQRALAASAKRFANRPLQQIGLYIDSAQAARFRLAENPSNTLALSDYNFAVSRLVGTIEDDGLSPWDAPLSCPSGEGGTWRLSFPPPDPRPEFHPSRLEILPTDRYDFKGKLVGERTIKQGLGAPAVVIGRNLDHDETDQFMHPKVIHYGVTALLEFNGSDCTLKLLDPLMQETVELDNNTYQLGADFQAALALGLAELDIKKKEIRGLLKPDKVDRAGLLVRLQPYDPKKIPVVCIHGLGNSPATWMPVLNFLRGDAEIRRNFQFLFFAYPSGVPYPMTTAVLRKELDRFTKRYPEHRDFVVIGHSMGGMIARLLISENGTALWDLFYDKPPEAIPFHPATRDMLSRAFRFDARSDISRVIFASASHRGSEDATTFVGKLGRKLVGNAFAEDQFDADALAYVRKDIETEGRKRLPNSIDVLRPDNRFLKAVDALPLKAGVPYHSIIGDRGKGGNLDRTTPESSDGVVPYWSSHLDGAVSEVIVPSGHWSHLHPLGMAEIKRILLYHLRSGQRQPSAHSTRGRTSAHLLSPESPGITRAGIAFRSPSEIPWHPPLRPRPSN